MKNLPNEVRNKAIEIANALLEDRDMDEGIAIPTAISRAKDWAANRGKPSTSDSGRTTDEKRHGEDRYVSPTDDGWKVTQEKSDSVNHFDTKKEAVKAAKDKARDANVSVTIKNSDGRIADRVSYNPNNSGKKE